MKLKEEEIPDYIRQGKDREVVPLLYKKVFPMVKNYVLKNSGRKEDASDVFQDALMIFYKQVIANSYNSNYKPFGFLYRVSINIWLNKIKREKRFVFKEELEDLMEEGDIDLENSTSYDENLLRTLFQPIGEKCIELLTCTIYFNMLLEDIKIRMGFASVDAVKMQQMRCKKKLIQEIEKNPALAQRIKQYE